MIGYIVNTDPAWFDFHIANNTKNPVFWFKRGSNPSSAAVVKDSLLFLRITGTQPPVIRAYASVTSFSSLPLHQAWKTYGIRLGYDSEQAMVDKSGQWTSSVELKPDSPVFCVELAGLRRVPDIRVDTDLDTVGIVFDYQHIVTGKAISEDQVSALLQLANRSPYVPASEAQATRPAEQAIEPDEESEENLSAKFLESHLQWFVFNNLTCLGIAGLRLYDPESQADTQGKYRTDEVGEIDILLKTPKGDIVVVELKKSGTDKTIGQICRYMGWVKHRLATEGQTVQGIVVTQDYDQRLAYAAHAVPGLLVKKVQVSFAVSSDELRLPE